MKRYLGFLAVLALCACATTAQPPTKAPHYRPHGAIAITAQPVPIDPARPGLDRLGSFVYAGGLVLTSPDTDRLHGLSDLKVDEQGHLISESDEGDLLRATIQLDAAGRLVGLTDATMTALTGLDGKPLDGKREADAEGVALWPNGDLMVSFERDHRIWIYPARGGPPRVAPKPDEAMPDNEGMEGLALAPSHGPDAYWVGVEGGHVYLCRLAGGCELSKAYPPPMTFRLSGLAETPDGNLVLLHHHWDPLMQQIHVTIQSRPMVQMASSQVVDELTLGPAGTIDNFEGVAVVRRPNGDFRFYLITDDNFAKNERTLLLAFDWKPRR